ncbi:MAG: hypothetical protein HOH65_00825 [Rhodospirillaceae bacterium]|jgi:hypothetical protein|nr:hypothetical protein [Rhodospirillaceae bacterium]
MSPGFKKLSSGVFEPLSQVVMVAGIIALVQPWNMFLHSYGLAIILVGLVGFIVFSHIKPGPEEE